MLRFLYTVLTIPAFGFLYVFTAITVLITSFFAYTGIIKPVRHIMRFCARSAFLVLGKKLRIHGTGNFKKGDRYILIANHSSLFDILAIISFYPDVSWFGREYLLKIPLFGPLLRKTGYIPMKTTGLRNTKEMIEQLIQNSDGKTIAIFPEGTRTLDGKIQPFHKGFIRVMQASKLDILPVTLNGFYLLKPKNRFYIDFSAKIDVIVHQPVKNEELILMNDSQIISRVKGMMESAYHR